MKNKNLKLLSLLMTSVMAAVMGSAISARAEEESGEVVGEWREEFGNKYWYENGEKQGTEGRGKEIYDPDSDAWYWLDSVDGGKMAVSKDVYQESQADDAGNTGKWVRYDAEGHMIKGWDTNEAGTYYFDLTYGTMAKGNVEIDGVPCWFDKETGIGVNCEWKEIDENEYWYEGGVRQGLEGRGKEIYDPGSKEWYWLDSVDNGKKAVSKDVYQESKAGDWAANSDGTGKWVRYDADGHMVKGWDTNKKGTYYFDLTYGTMARGTVVIDGTICEFDRNSGVLIAQRELASVSSYNIHSQDYSAWATVVKSYLCGGKEDSFYRIEYLDLEKRIVVEEYNKDNILLRNFDIPMELSVFGGFYAGDDANFFVFGESNSTEDDNTEVFRIVKYSKDWERQGSGSLFGANTTIPFAYSSLRMSETDNILYVLTGHEMYTSSDGLNHQANVQIAVDKNTMEITDSRTNVSYLAAGYVSHSFNQYIKVDNDRVLTVNHGDAYPRGVILGRFRNSASIGKFSGFESLCILNFPGRVGDDGYQYTQASVGGLEVSDTSYLIAGNTVAQDQNYKTNMTRNVFLAIVPKDNFSEEDVEIKWVTSYPEGSNYSASTPQLVEISKNKYAVLWEEKVNNGYTYVNNTNKVKIAYFDGEGNQLGELREMAASLSDCHPIVINDRVIWYVTANGKPQWYYLGSD